MNFFFAVISDRFNTVSEEEIKSADVALSNSIAFLENTLNIKLEAKPKLILENRSLRHYGEIAGGATSEIRGRFDPSRPDCIYVIRGSGCQRTVAHELMHYTINHMDWNPRQKEAYRQFVIGKQWYNRDTENKLMVVHAIEECMCYLFDSLYIEKKTGKKFVNAANKDIASANKFAEKFYTSLKKGWPGIAVNSFVFNLERKYKKSETVLLTVETRLIHAINLLVLDHNNWDLRAAFFDMMQIQKLQQRDLYAALSLLGTYVPADFPMVNSYSILSED